MKITKFRPNDQQNSLVGYFSLMTKIRFGEKFEFVAPIYLNECKLFIKDEKTWVTFPDRKFQSQDGLAKYFPFFGFLERDMGDEFQKLVLCAISAYFHEEVKQGRVDHRIAHQSKINHVPGDIQYPHVYAKQQTDDLSF
jgi:hypothetical protein